MKSIDEARLESDPQYRYEYLADFIGFGPDDVAMIQDCAPELGPLIPSIVEKTYQKLLTYDSTARHFVPRSHGFAGATPNDVSSLSPTHPQIQFRRDHLIRYFMQLLGRSYDAKMVQYLDMVGKIHTPNAGNQEIHIPLVQMNALMGLMTDILTEVVISLPMPPDQRMRTIQAFSKLMWIQNDFISRHYARLAPTAEPKA